MCAYYILTNAIRCTKSNFRLHKREQVGSDQITSNITEIIQYHREFERNIHHNDQFSQRLKINPIAKINLPFSLPCYVIFLVFLIFYIKIIVPIA